MHMQLFEVIANFLALLVLAALGILHIYGRRRFELGENRSDAESHH